MRVRLAWLIVLVAPSAARAQHLDARAGSTAQLVLFGAPTLAEPAAVFGNPGALPFSSHRVSVALALTSQTAYVARLGAMVNDRPAEARDASGPTAAPTFAVTIPVVAQRLFAGLGYRFVPRPAWRYPPPQENPADDSVRYLGRRLAGAEHQLSMALALAVWRLGLGLALHVGVASLTHERALFAGAPSDQLEDARVDVNGLLELSGASVALSGGLFLRVARWLDVALHLRIPLRARMAGSLVLTPGRAPSGYQSIAALSGSAELELASEPLLVNASGALHLGPLTVTLGGHFARASMLDDPQARIDGASLLLLGGGVSRTEPLETLALGLRFRDTFGVGAGLDWRALPQLLLRVSWAFMRGAMRDNAPSSVGLDLDRHRISSGLTLAVASRWLVGLAVAHTLGPPLHTAGDQSLIVNPIAPTHTRAVGAGSYRTTTTTALLDTQWSF